MKKFHLLSREYRHVTSAEMKQGYRGHNVYQVIMEIEAESRREAVLWAQKKIPDIKWIGGDYTHVLKENLSNKTPLSGGEPRG